MSATLPDTFVRWMIHRDLGEVLNIEAESFDHPWTDDEFVRCLRTRNAIGMVVESGGSVVGYMIYELCQRKLRLVNFAVAADRRRQGIGRVMIDKLKNKLSSDRRTRIEMLLRETNISGHLFFRACGFRATSVVRGLYEDTDEDAYLFQYRFESE